MSSIGPENGTEPGRLRARPAEPSIPGDLPAGVQPLGIGGARDSYLFVPEGLPPADPAPLVLMLHGAGGHAHHGLAPLLDVAREKGVLLLAPASRDSTWDVILGRYGPDVELINQSLQWLFARQAIDPRRLAIGGFSDGASYALSLGIANGDLFTHILALSPGFMSPPAQRGAPEIFISHGAADTVLPVDRCSRRLVPQLRGAGYAVEYLEFQGGHTVPPEIAREALERV